MSDAFSSNSESVIQRVVDVSAKTNTPVDKLQDLYQIKDTCEFINERKFAKVRPRVVGKRRCTFFAFWTLESDVLDVHPFTGCAAVSRRAARGFSCSSAAD